MSIINRVRDAYATLRGVGQVSYVESKQPENVQEKRKRSAAEVPKEIQRFRGHEDIRTLETAILDLESTQHNRENLHRIFRQYVEEDLHVSSQWQTRKIKTLKKDFAIFPKGSDDPDDKMTEIFQNVWFSDFIEAALDSKLWGYSLIELFNWNKSSQAFEPFKNTDGRMMDAVNVINHDYVKPEFGIIAQRSSDTQGVDFMKVYPNQTIFCGGKTPGIYYKLARPALFKSNSLSSWSEWIEVFGLDGFWIKTAAKDLERKKLVEAIQKFGSSRVGTLDPDDEISIIGANKTDAYMVFEKLVRLIDEGISKIIHGQDVISNNTGQVVGEVGENVANDYTDADAWFIDYTVNKKLFPMMTRAKHLDLSNYEFRYDQQLSTREMKARAEIDKMVSDMGFAHDPEQINERYNVNVETKMVASFPSIQNQLRKLYPNKNPE